MVYCCRCDDMLATGNLIDNRYVLRMEVVANFCKVGV
jgi:hypothetical protein